MKKKIGLAKAVEEMSRQELEDLSTKALLARLKRLRWCYEDMSAADDYLPSEIATVDHKILFKSDPRWKSAYGDVKSILDAREHIISKP